MMSARTIESNIDVLAIMLVLIGLSPASWFIDSRVSSFNTKLARNKYHEIPVYALTEVNNKNRMPA